MKFCIKSLFVIIISLIISLETFSSVKRLCKVKYKTEDGWSVEKIYEVEFVTGGELNTRIGNNKFKQYQAYCLIWFGPDQVAILKTSGFGTMIYSEKFSAEDFKSLFMIKREIDCTQENDDNEREWIIIGKELIDFVDPRANEKN